MHHPTDRIAHRTVQRRALAGTRNSSMGRCSCALLMAFYSLQAFHSYIEEGRNEMFYLTTHSTHGFQMHFIYGYMASDI